MILKSVRICSTIFFFFGWVATTRGHPGGLPRQIHLGERDRQAEEGTLSRADRAEESREAAAGGDPITTGGC